MDTEKKPFLTEEDAIKTKIIEILDSSSINSGGSVKSVPILYWGGVTDKIVSLFKINPKINELEKRENKLSQEVVNCNKYITKKEMSNLESENKKLREEREEWKDACTRVEAYQEQLEHDILELQAELEQLKQQK